jgi:hypothetical protein
MAALEHFSSQNLDLADWPVWRKLIDRLGSKAPLHYKHGKQLREYAIRVSRRLGVGVATCRKPDKLVSVQPE